MSIDNTHISHLENLNNFSNNVCQKMKEIPKMKQQIKRKYIPARDLKFSFAKILFLVG